jgi:acetyl-CoA carboxylase alpha subunit
MKLMRFALFFAAGTYLGFNAERMGDWQTIAQTIRDLVEQLRDLR